MASHARVMVLAFAVMGLVVLGYAQKAPAAPGDLDPSFSSDGKVRTDFGSERDYGSAMAVQPDGKVVVAGTHTGRGFALARYNPDGTLDTTFGTAGKGKGLFDAHAQALAIGPDGKIVVVGWERQYDSIEAPGIIVVERYNPDGTPDTTFGGYGIVRQFLSDWEAVATAVTFQGTKVVVAGYTDGGQSVAVLRYLDNGALDPTFSDDGKLTTVFSGARDFPRSIAIQGDGKIVVAGEDLSGFALARYDSSGNLDPTFSGDGKRTTAFGAHPAGAHSVAIEDDGRIVAAGYCAKDFALARYNEDGTPDDTFSKDGRLKTDFASGIDWATGVGVQPDGKIVAAGTAYTGTDSDFALARYYGGSYTLAPKVTSASPANKATGVARSTNITATFSHKMDPVTLSGSTFQLFEVSDGSTMRVARATVSKSHDGLKGRLNPFGRSSDVLKAHTKYKVIVTTKTKDLSGNVLDQNSTQAGSQPKVWTFTTGSG